MAVRRSPRPNVNPDQFAMFMSAKDIVGSYDPNPADVESFDDGDVWREEEPHETWERKADEAESYGLRDEIEMEGVRRPVNLYTGGTLGNGHHRVATMLELNRDALIPVLHHSNRIDAIRGGYAHDSHEWSEIPDRYPIGARTGASWGPTTRRRVDVVKDARREIGDTTSITTHSLADIRNRRWNTDDLV